MLRQHFRARPRLHRLEDRLAPAALVWTDAGRDGAWANPLNWFNTTTHNFGVPTSADDAVFDTGVAGVPGGGSNADALLRSPAITPAVGSLTIGPGYAPTGQQTGTVTLDSDLVVGTTAGLSAVGGSVSLTGLGTLVLTPGHRLSNVARWTEAPGFTFTGAGATVLFGGAATQTVDSGGPTAQFGDVGVTPVPNGVDVNFATLQLVSHPLTVLGTLTVGPFTTLDTNGQTVSAGSALFTNGHLTATVTGPLAGPVVSATSTIDVTGAGLTVNLGAGSPATITLLHANNGITGTFLGLADGATVPAGNTALTIHYGGNDVTLTGTGTGGGPGAVTAPFAVGADAGAAPQVHVYNADGSLRLSFNAYNQGFHGGVRVATADFNGDGVPDVVTGAGSGGGPHVEVFDGQTGALLQSFYAYDPSFGGGVFVAAGDVTGDGVPDIVTGAGAGGGPHVKVFDGRTGASVQSFYAYDTRFAGGVTVAVGDLTRSGAADIVTGAGAGGGPHVREFDGRTGALLGEFFAYDPGFTGGVFVATLSTGTGPAEIVTGAGAGGGPHVRVFSPDGQVAEQFFAFGASFAGGARVAGVVGAGGVGYIVVGAGPGGGSEVRVFSASAPGAALQDFAAFPDFAGGVFVG